jgi:cytochrome P450
VLDVNEELKRFTVDVTTQLVFGHDMNTLERKDDDVIQRDLEQVFPALNRRLNALFPYWRYLKLPADRRLDRALASLRTWLDGRIQEARAQLEADPSRAERPTNFLESMLVSRDESGQPFSNDALFGNAMNMLLAGEDTTAYSLSWAIHYLCEEAAARDTLRAEVDRVLGEEHVPKAIEQVEALRYATAVANEAMRLRSIVPYLLFEPLRDVVVGDIAIPRGTGIAVLMRLPARNERHFTGADAFRPERWLGDARPFPKHDASVHVPFGSGPRICPGRSLALVEMRVVLATLYRSFDVERVGRASDVKEKSSFTMTPVGLRVRLRERE